MDRPSDLSADVFSTFVGDSADRRAETAEYAVALPEVPTITFPPPIAAGSILDAADVPIEYAIEGWVPRSEVTQMFGGHGLFKSTIALGQCCCVATGRPWGEAKTTIGKACFITLEDRIPLIRRRIRAWLEGVPEAEREEAKQLIGTNLLLLTRENTLGFELTQRAGRFVMRATSGAVEHVTMIASQCAMVVVETVARLHVGSEDNDDLKVLARVLEEIATRSRAGIEIIHHTAKEAVRAGIVDSYGGRGGGALADAVRSVISISRARPEEGEAQDPLAPILVRHEKSTLDEPEKPMTWKPTTIEGGVYLKMLTPNEIKKDTAQKMIDVLKDAGAAGIGRDELIKSKKPKGVSPKAASKIIDRCVEGGLIIERLSYVGTQKKAKRIYYAPEFAPEE